MSYQSSTIATIVKRLNVQYFLPAIQREFVWKPEQIIQLFDSVMRGYPISSFLFWRLDSGNYDNWQVFQFMQHASQAGTHSELANINGVRDLTLVLDGQQRLTSLYIGLKGTYTIKKRWMRWDNPNAWVQAKLYLNLLKDPAVTDDDVEIGVRYGFEFLPDKPEQDAEHYWFEVGKILNFDGQDAFDAYLDKLEEQLPEAMTRGQARLIRRNLTRLRDTIWKDEIISYYTEVDQNYDRVLDIFVRANEGGTKLSKSDLLLSMVTARWGDVNARDEIFGFVDYINAGLTRKNDFDKDFVMKTCLVLTDLPVQYLVKNFNNTNLGTIRSQWEDIKKAIAAGVDLGNSFGIDRDTLTSTNALIPVVYFLYKHPKAAPQHGSSPTDVENATLIRRWLLMALLNNVFTGQSDFALTATRRMLAEHVAEAVFPAEAISVELAKSGRLTHFNDQAIANFLEIRYGQRETFLALSLLYDENSWGTVQYHQDHIFPKSHFTPARLEAAGIVGAQQERYRSLVDRIGNLELLSGHENVEKLNKPFAEWITTRHANFRQRHLIPDDPALLELEHFERFIAAREQLIRQRLRALFAPVPTTVKEAL